MLRNSEALAHLARDPTYSCRLQGRLHVLSKNGKWETHFGVVKANMLFVFKKDVTKPPMSVHIIEDCHVEVCDDNETGKPFSFCVKHRSSGNSYTFAAECLSSLKKWVSVLSMSTLEYIRLTTQMYRDQIAHREEPHNHSE